MGRRRLPQPQRPHRDATAAGPQRRGPDASTGGAHTQTRPAPRPERLTAGRCYHNLHTERADGKTQNHRRIGERATRIPAHQEALYGLGLAFATYSATVVSPRGSGLIAVLVAAIVLGVRRPDLRDRFAEGVGEIAEIGVFTVFGSLLTLRGADVRRLGCARRRHGAARSPDCNLDRPCGHRTRHGCQFNIAALAVVMSVVCTG
jgi:hypothetical protein